MQDHELVAAAVAGDRAAFAQIFSKYCDSVHDFSWSMLRNRAQAEDVTQDTFVIASQKLVALREPSKLKAWLFAIARNECMRRFRHTKKEILGTVADDLISTSGQEVASVAQRELTELIWEAAEALNDRERLLLELHLKQGLSGQDLADAMGLELTHTHTALDRMRDTLGKSLGSLLVANQGRKECLELAEILTSWDGKFSTVWRKRVARHTEGCSTCQKTRAKLFNPGALSAMAAMLPLSSTARERIAQKLELVEIAPTGSTASPIELEIPEKLTPTWQKPSKKVDIEPLGYGWKPDGFPTPVELARRKGLVLVFATMLAAGILLGLLAPRLLSASEPTPQPITTSSSTTTSTTTTSQSSSTSSSTTLSTSVQTLSTSLTTLLTSQATTRATTPTTRVILTSTTIFEASTTSSSSSSTSTTTSSTTTSTTVPELRMTLEVASPRVANPSPNCISRNPTTTRATLTIDGGTPPYQVASGVSFAGGGTTRTGIVGPFPSLFNANAVVEVTVSDSSQQSVSKTIAVYVECGVIG